VTAKATLTMTMTVTATMRTTMAILKYLRVLYIQCPFKVYVFISKLNLKKISLILMIKWFNRGLILWSGYKDALKLKTHRYFGSIYVQYK
jgi:hypothetical protein